MTTEADRTAGSAAAGAHPAVLYADIAGSTRLYEVLGDAEAERLIEEVLSASAAITQQHGGRVIKTVGDAIMCLFASAELGFRAATAMQYKVDSLPVTGGLKRRIRIGFHAGPVIEEAGELLGDTVSIAAAMSGRAKGMQIMTTRSTIEALPSGLRGFTREIKAIPVKGGADDIVVCEVLWQDQGELIRAMATLAVGRGVAGG